MKYLCIFYLTFWANVILGQSYVQNTTPYSWVDISDGTVIPASSPQDNQSYNIPIPFDFNFFGTVYTECYANANALVSFASSTAFNNACIPVTTNPNNIIAAYWDDLIYDETCASAYWTYKTTGVAPNRIFIIAWNDFYRKTTSCGNNISVQVKLFETSHKIEVHFKSNTIVGALATSGTIGIENSDGTVGYQVICNEATIDGTAWKWEPNICVLPDAAGTITGTASVCNGATSVSYSVSEIPNATTYIWSYSGSGVTINGNSNNVTLDFASDATSGILTVAGNNVCGNGTVSPDYSILAYVTPEITETVPGYNCGAGSVTLGATATGGTINWYSASSGGGSLATGPTYTTSSISVNTPYYVDATNGGCTSSSRTEVMAYIQTLPSQPSVIAGNTSVCEGSSENYSVTNVSGVTYNWSFPTGWSQTAGGTSNSVTVTVGSGTGNVSVTPSNICGDGTARTLAVSLGSVPVQPSAITGNSSVCVGSSETYSVTNVPGTTYTWSFPSGWSQTSGGTSNSDRKSVV